MSGSDSVNNQVRYSRRAFMRTFVHLEKRMKAVPSKREFEKLKNAGRVKEIAFTKNHTAGEIEQLIVSHFPALVGLDLSRLRIISSYNRGHSMSVVHRGVPDGNEVMQEFGGDAKKKIFLYWKRGTSSSNPTVDNVPSSAAPDSSSSSLTTPSLTLPLSSTASSTPSSTTTSQILPSSTTTSSVSPSTSTSQTLSSSATPSLSASAQLSVGTSLPSQASFAPSLSVPANVAHTNTSSMVMSSPVTTPAAQDSLPGNGRSAQLSIADDDNDDDDDIELLQSPFDDVVVVNAFPQVRRQRRIYNPATRTSTTTRTINTVTQNIGFYGTAFYGDGIRAGTVKEDLLPDGLDGTSSFDSRTDEVSRCESLLQASCSDEDASLLPFLNHTFEEVCWQAYENKRAIAVVLLNPTSQSQIRENILRFLQKVKSDSSNEEWYYWAALTSSSNGQKGTELQDFDVSRLYERVREMIQGLTLERDQLALTRQLRQDQENDLNEALQHDNDTNIHIAEEDNSEEQANTNMREEDREPPKINVTDKEEKEIREARLARISQEPTQGHTVRVRTPIGVVSRMFGVASHYQEVYDWVGAQNEMPLHFTLHSCRGTNAVIPHEQTILADETVNLTERDEQEVSTLQFSEVSFKGNYGHERLENLPETIVDKGSKDKQTTDEEEEKQAEMDETDVVDVGHVRQKRKRKDNRATKDRRKKHKKESKEVQKKDCDVLS